MFAKDYFNIYWKPVKTNPSALISFKLLIISRNEMLPLPVLYCQQFLDAVPSIVHPVIKYLLLSQLCKIEQCFDNWQTSYYCFYVRVFRSACLFFNPCIFSSCKVFAVLNFCSFCLGFDKCDQSNITACNTTQNKKNSTLNKYIS